MFDVFSNTKRMSDKIQAAKTCAGALFTMTLLQGSNEEPLYMLKPKAIFVLTWINRKILYELPKAKHTDAKWIWVRVRIATSMFNKLVEDGIIDKDMSIEYHRRLITNVRLILGEINTEDLPF